MPWFPLNPLTAELLLRLGGTEEIGGKLGAAHVIKDLLAFLKPLAAVDVLSIQPAIEAHVTVILENGVVAGFDDTCILGGGGGFGGEAEGFLVGEGDAGLLETLFGGCGRDASCVLRMISIGQPMWGGGADRTEGRRILGWRRRRRGWRGDAAAQRPCHAGTASPGKAD